MLDYIMHLSPGILIALVIVIFIALVSQAALYAKAGEPWVSALVPFWNVMVFVDVVGRPKWQGWIIMVPGLIILSTVAFYWPELNGLFPVFDEAADAMVAGPSSWSDVTVPLTIIGVSALPMIVFIMIIFTEICDSFGKHKLTDKIFCIIFNGAYVLFVIALANDVYYEAPWYKKKHGLPYTVPEDPRKIKAQQMAKAQAMAKAAGHGHYGHRKK